MGGRCPSDLCAAKSELTVFSPKPHSPDYSLLIINTSILPISQTRNLNINPPPPLNCPNTLVDPVSWIFLTISCFLLSLPLPSRGWGGASQFTSLSLYSNLLSNSGSETGLWQECLSNTNMTMLISCLQYSHNSPLFKIKPKFITMTFQGPSWSDFLSILAVSSPTNAHCPGHVDFCCNQKPSHGPFSLSEIPNPTALPGEVFVL